MSRPPFSKRLRQARLRKGYSQRDVARILGISHGAYGHWESGRNLPDAEMTGKLAQLLDVSTDWLILGKVRERHFEEDVIYAKAAKDREQRIRELEEEFRALIERAKKDLAAGIPSESTIALAESDASRKRKKRKN